MNVRLQSVSLNEIGETIGTPPNSRFTASVRRMGIIQPVLLAETTTDSGEIQYLIIDGNRRIQSARRAKLRSVPGLVMTDLTADQRSQLTLVANGFRSPNYLTEFWAIKTLERGNFSSDDVMKIAGMSESVMATRERLSNLHRDLFVGLRNGKVSQANAITVARMNRDDQESLAEIFSRHGKLLKRDVDNQIAKTGQKVPSPQSRVIPQHDTQSMPSGIRFAPSTAIDSSPASKTLTSVSTVSGSHSGSERSFPDQVPNDVLHTESTVPTPIPDHGRNTPTSEPTEIPTIASRAVNHVRNAVLAAQVLDFTREDFLEMAGRVWDETVENQTMRAHASYNKTPNLATLTWDKGES